MFDAPRKHQQVWFVRRFGPDVNLGNIAPDDVLPLETLRLGLRSDTLGHRRTWLRRVRSPACGWRAMGRRTTTASRCGSRASGTPR